jgi:GNAT superfamily N-acetyltransferase
VITARLVPMPEAELAQWRASRAGDRVPVPEPDDHGRQVAVIVQVDDVAVGGAMLQHVQEPGSTRCLVRVLQTTLPHDADAPWAAVVAALESHAQAGGATVLAAAVSPDLASVFGQAGFQATMATMGKRLDPASALELQDDRRVSVRPMTDSERLRFAVEVQELLYAGMGRAGVVDRSGSRLDAMENKIAELTADPPPDSELLMIGLVDGVPVGRAWATLVPGDDGLDFFGNTLDLFPEYRGQRLTPSFLGALRRHVRDLGVRDVHLRVYGHDVGARRTFLENGAGVADVHLRKDLR